ncbi:hypothetical protein IBF23_05855 [Francisella tularensis]|uniref:hypothetical protein n=1 Tax=Francisella tularensis TaxID=263 RepID=UPI001C0EF0E3|nr:hypothetical protein [Francisella tularensis]MBK2142341.1 hypothetical protein [Francisella tularensis]
MRSSAASDVYKRQILVNNVTNSVDKNVQYMQNTLAIEFIYLCFSHIPLEKPKVIKS